MAKPGIIKDAETYAIGVHYLPFLVEDGQHSGIQFVSDGSGAATVEFFVSTQRYNPQKGKLVELDPALNQWWHPTPYFFQDAAGAPSPPSGGNTQGYLALQHIGWTSMLIVLTVTVQIESIAFGASQNGAS